MILPITGRPLCGLPEGGDETSRTSLCDHCERGRIVLDLKNAAVLKEQLVSAQDGRKDFRHFGKL